MTDFAIQFSGGKDSLAALYSMRPFFDRARAYFANTGGAFPHVVEFVRKTCERLGVELVEVAPPLPLGDYHAQYGLPADIVPLEATRELRDLMGAPASAGPLLQSHIGCCASMIWLPMQQRMIDDGIKFIVRGSKKADAHVGRPDGFVDEAGRIYMSPLWDWSDDQVLAYLREQGAELLPHYETGNASFDCALCTGFLTEHGARHRLEWTRANHPAIWRDLSARLENLRRALDQGRAGIADCLEMAALGAEGRPQ